MGTAREECTIVGEYPRSYIPVRHPAIPPSGRTHLGLETPTVRTGVDQSSRVILARGNGDSEARADRSFFFPLKILPHVHRGPTAQIDCDSDARVRHARTIGVKRRASERRSKVSAGIGKYNGHVA